jgi:uncharacterized delta-60 repeat protein
VFRGTWLSTTLLIAVTLIPGFSPPAAAAPGDLDPSFDGDGRVTTDVTRRGDFSIGMALQQDGKIITAGIAGNRGSNPKFALVRYNGDGTLDSTFGGDGKVTTDFTPRTDAANVVTVDPDGKIVAAGVAGRAGPNPRFALARYNSDGTLDTSFSGDGKLATDFSRHYDSARDVAIDADSKIVAAGTVDWGRNPNFGVARYNPDGSLDTSFSADGKVTVDVSGRGDNAFGMVIQLDGTIVVVGEAGFGGNRTDSRFALVRLATDGAMDTLFSSDGKALTQFTRRFDVALDVALDDDSKIVAVGAAGAWANKRFALARYHSDGSLDTSFSGDGRVMTDLTPNHDDGGGVAIQQDGRIVVAGHVGYRLRLRSNSAFGLARYSSDGSLDTSFGEDGTTITNFTRRDDFAVSVAIQSDEKIIAAGGAGGGTFAAARYLPT